MKEITIQRSELEGAGIQPYVAMLLLGHDPGTLSAATMPKAMREFAARHNVLMALMMPDASANFRGGNVWVTGWAGQGAEEDWRPERCQFVVEQETELMMPVTLELKMKLSGRVLRYDADIPSGPVSVVDEWTTLGAILAQCPELADEVLRSGDTLAVVIEQPEAPEAPELGSDKDRDRMNKDGTPPIVWSR